MKIELDNIIQQPTEKYPYTHRVKVYIDYDSSEEEQLDDWLKKSGIKYSNPGRGVYYLGPKDTTAFMLRWS